MVRLVRFENQEGGVTYGIEHADMSITVAEGCPYTGSLKDTGRKALNIKQRLAPVQPSAVICIGLNYGLHAKELGLPCPTNPVVFTKPSSSAVGHGAEVVKPRDTKKLDYEVELAVVIGKACKDVTVDDALQYVLGYTVANDLSTRDWQKVPELAGGQWCRSKGFDGFSPLGPVLVTADEIPDPNSLKLRSFVNGEKRQDSSTSDFIFNVQQVISFLSNGCTLQPGTVILTGTPAGVAEGMPGQPWLSAGDKVVVEIAGIGALETTIVADMSIVKCYLNMPSKL